jgi:hypothetical protein
MWRLAFCRACSACRRALRLDCYRASCPCPGRRWHLSRRRWTCRSRSGSASSNSPWSTTYRGSQNLPPGRRSWSHDRLARHLVHMRRFRKASARPQLRLLRASWPFLSVDHDNSLSKAGFRDKLRQAERFRRTSARQQSASGLTRVQFCSRECASRRSAFAIHGAGRNFQRFVVPHLCFSEQSPAFKGVKHRALTAQRFHCTVANEILHFSPPTCLPPDYLKPISRACHYDSVRFEPGTLASHRGYLASD